MLTTAPPAARDLLDQAVSKRFPGYGVHEGRIDSYDNGMYRVIFDDGDAREFTEKEVRKMLKSEGASTKDAVLPVVPQRLPNPLPILIKKVYRDVQVVSGRALDKVPKFDRCAAFLKWLRIPEQMLNHRYDCYYVDDGREDATVRYGQKYVVPRDWCKFGLDVGDEMHKDWGISFHGTSCNSLRSIILSGGLRPPGTQTADGSVVQKVKGHLKWKEPRVFTSPTILYAGLYAKPLRFKGRFYQVVLQLRQDRAKASEIKHTLPHRWARHLELDVNVKNKAVGNYTTELASLQVYAILVREHGAHPFDDPEYGLYAQLKRKREQQDEARQEEAKRRKREKRAAEQRKAEQREAERVEAECREAERVEAERREAERREAERREAVRLEAERREAERREREADEERARTVQEHLRSFKWRTTIKSCLRLGAHSRVRRLQESVLAELVGYVSRRVNHPVLEMGDCKRLFRRKLKSLVDAGCVVQVGKIVKLKG